MKEIKIAAQRNATFDLCIALQGMKNLQPSKCQCCDEVRRRLIPYEPDGKWLCMRCFRLWKELDVWAARTGQPVRPRRALLA